MQLSEAVNVIQISGSEMRRSAKANIVTLLLQGTKPLLLKKIKIHIMSGQKYILHLSLLMIVLTSSTFTYKPEKESPGETGFAFIELFTSEGCSSCPPADLLVSKILKETNGRQVYVLCYHVDYWDYLGWKDIYSNHDYSLRQRQYAQLLNDKTVYTPQIVVNGQSGFVGSNESALRAAIKQERFLEKSLEIQVEGVAATGKNIQLSYNIRNRVRSGRIYVALIQKSGTTHIRSGENKGETLEHVNIVRSLTSRPAHEKSGLLSIEIPNDLVDNNREIIVFVQDTETGKIFTARKITNTRDTAKK